MVWDGRGGYHPPVRMIDGSIWNALLQPLSHHHFYGQFCTPSTPKIKYSLAHISTYEQTVEKRRKPRKIKGLRRFFSGKDRGKCERLTPFFPTFWGEIGSTSPFFLFSGGKSRWKSGQNGGKPIKWGSFPQKVANREILLFFMQNFHKNAPFSG